MPDLERQEQSLLASETDHFTSPKHVALIPDAQDTWDYAQIKPVFDALETTVEALGKQGVKTVSVYVEDLDMAFRLGFLHNYRKQEAGNTDEKVSPSVQFRSNGRKEILYAVKHALREGIESVGKAESEEEKQKIRQAMADTITEESFGEMMDSEDKGDIDFQVHFGPHHKLATMMIWQSAYAELGGTETSFTDITGEEVTDILQQQYKPKNRRFGGLPSPSTE